MPWSREAAKAQVSGSGGGIEPNKDLKSVAETFAKTSTNPAQKDKWERFVNSLSQLEAIEITRGLNAEENKIKDDIMKEISNASNDLSTLAINAPPYAPPLAKPPKPAPATAADIAGLLAQFQQGQPLQPKVKQQPPPEQQSQPPPSDVKTPGLIPVIRNNMLGVPTQDEADVKLDLISNLTALKTILINKFGTKRPKKDDMERWGSALSELNTKINERNFMYKPPQVGSSDFAGFITQKLLENTPGSNIFVSYMVEPDSAGNVTTARLTAYSDSNMISLVEESARGKFFFHPNYKVV